ncbi:MAG: DNA repair protein RadA [Chloroflexota bacterium]
MPDNSKFRAIFVCQNCGRESLKWLGRCPGCQQWNSFVEQASARTTSWVAGSCPSPQELSSVERSASSRLSLGSAEFDRVLGGGLVSGSVVLVGGDPGIGKSTLLLQVCSSLAGRGGRIVYVSGEESPQQLRLRAERLGASGEGIYLYTETNLELVLEALRELSPSLVVVDSIQTVYHDDVSGAPGSISQIRETTLRLLRWAKNRNVPVLITGHVTKDGAIAGPRTLEHIVDVVLYLEGESTGAHRILRSVKNRFGATNEIGIFEMRSSGLVEVENPSQFFLSEYQGLAGSVAVATMEGSRPLLVEIQALTAPVAFGAPRRVANGVDFNRLLLMVAVLARRVRLRLGNQDVVVNAAGGLRIVEPAADLGIALAIVSSFWNSPVNPQLVAVGEVGLSGEIRMVPQVERRVAEAARLGFKLCLVPRAFPVAGEPSGIRLLRAVDLAQALRLGITRRAKQKEDDPDEPAEPL